MLKLRASRLQKILLGLGVAIIIWALWMPFFELVSINDDGINIVPIIAIQVGILLFSLAIIIPWVVSDISSYREKRRKN